MISGPNFVAKRFKSSWFVRTAPGLMSRKPGTIVACSFDMLVSVLSTVTLSYSGVDTFSMLLLVDPQKAASVQAMLADFFGENCGHF